VLLAVLTSHGLGSKSSQARSEQLMSLVSTGHKGSTKPAAQQMHLAFHAGTCKHRPETSVQNKVCGIAFSSLSSLTCCILDRQQKEEAAAKAAIKQKGKRNTKLLSFEEEEEPGQAVLAKPKIRSYHDVADDKR